MEPHPSPATAEPEPEPDEHAIEQEIGQEFGQEIEDTAAAAQAVLEQGPGWGVWAQSAVNAVFGDRLHEQQIMFAVRMAIYSEQGRLPADAGALSAVLADLQPPVTRRICLLVHGLGCSESVWYWRERPDGPRISYGRMLQAELGYTPLALRYNTGLAIATNGHDLAHLINTLVAAWPEPVDELLLIGHSMGGLLLRYACHAAALEHLPWLKQVHRAVYLGTPHEGVDLERLTHAAVRTLYTIPNPITRLVGRFLDLRSQGIHDLGRGALHMPGAPDEPAPEEPTGAPAPARMPWTPGIEHCLINGMVSSSPRNPAGFLLGDGLVRPLRPPRGAEEPVVRLCTLPGVHHLALARSHAVFAQILAWCGAEAASG